jgi:hypothetical protein
MRDAREHRSSGLTLDYNLRSVTNAQSATRSRHDANKNARPAPREFFRLDASNGRIPVGMIDSDPIQTKLSRNRNRMSNVRRHLARDPTGNRQWFIQVPPI